MLKLPYLIPLLTLGMFFQSCSKLDDPADSIPTDSIISVSAFYDDTTTVVTSIDADSNSHLLLRAILGEKTNPNQSVIFSTSAGVLTLVGQPSSMGTSTLTVPAAYREAIVVLHSGKTPHEEVLISASVGVYSNSMTVKFNKAYPEQINTGPDFISISPSDTFSVSLDAFRNSGVVSNGIVYHVQNLAPDSIPLNLPSYGLLNNEEGTFKVINPLTKSGTVKLKISVPTALDSIHRIVQVTYL